MSERIRFLSGSPRRPKNAIFRTIHSSPIGALLARQQRRRALSAELEIRQIGLQSSANSTAPALSRIEVACLRGYDRPIVTTPKNTAIDASSVFQEKSF